MVGWAVWLGERDVVSVLAKLRLCMELLFRRLRDQCSLVSWVQAFMCQTHYIICTSRRHVLYKIKFEERMCGTYEARKFWSAILSLFKWSYFRASDRQYMRKILSLCTSLERSTALFSYYTDWYIECLGLSSNYFGVIFRSNCFITHHYYCIPNIIREEIIRYHILNILRVIVRDSRSRRDVSHNMQETRHVYRWKHPCVTYTQQV